MKNLLQASKDLHPQIIEWRRHFHKHAELSFCEFETSDFIEAQLKSFGNVEISRPTKTERVIAPPPARATAETTEQAFRPRSPQAPAAKV